MLLHFDEYVPLRFRTYTDGIGAGYLRLGNYSTSLLELIIEPCTQMLRGFTVTSFNRLSTWPQFSVRDVSRGLPVLSTDFDFEGSGILDLPIEFRVSVREREVLVAWADLEQCDAYRLDRIRFLVQGGYLRGIWITELTEVEMNYFCFNT